MQPDVTQRIRHRLVRRHVGVASGSEQRGQRIVIAGGEFQRVVAPRLDHRLLDAEFALDLRAGDEHGAQAGNQVAERLAQREHRRGRVLRMGIAQADALEECREQRAVVGHRFGLRRGRARGAPRDNRRWRCDGRFVGFDDRWRCLRCSLARWRRRRDRTGRRYGCRRWGGGGDALQQVLVPVVRQQVVSGNRAAGVQRQLADMGRRAERVLHHRRVVSLGGTVERRLVRVWRQRIEIMRELRRGWRVARAQVVRLVEWIALRPGWPERIHRERVGKRTVADSATWTCVVVLHQTHLDLIGTDAHPIAVMQAAQVAGADGVVLAVEIGPVGGGVGELP